MGCTKFPTSQNCWRNIKRWLEPCTNPPNHLKLAIFAEIVQTLEPFYEVSTRCQAEAVLTASLVVPSVTHLLAHLSDVQQLITVVETRFAGIVDRINQKIVAEDAPFCDPLYFMAAVLDPQFAFSCLGDLSLPWMLKFAWSRWLFKWSLMKSVKTRAMRQPLRLRWCRRIEQRSNHLLKQMFQCKKNENSSVSMIMLPIPVIQRSLLRPQRVTSSDEHWHILNSVEVIISFFWQCVIKALNGFSVSIYGGHTSILTASSTKDIVKESLHHWDTPASCALSNCDYNIYSNEWRLIF